MRTPLEVSPGLDAVDTSYAAKGRFRDNSNCRFWLGKPQAIGGWERVVGTPLTGACRSLLALSTASADLIIGAGTNTNLQIVQGGVIYDITPAQGYVSIPVTAAGSAYTSASITFPAAPTGYRQATGTVTIGTGSQAGLILAVIITDPGAYPAGTLAVPTLTTAGGSGATLGAPILASFTPGAVDGTGGAGYGTGAFSTGEYSQPSSTAYYPLTWSLAPWGDDTMMACPRGQGIFWWKGATATPAVPLYSDAAPITGPARNVPTPPAAVNYMLTTPQVTVMALGCTEAYGPDGLVGDAAFNSLCIRESDAGDPLDWNPTSTNVSSQTILDGAGRLVGAVVVGLDTVYAWTDSGLYQGAWTGNASQPRAWSLVSKGCGLIGPNAAVVVGQTAYWMDGTHQLWSCALGASPIPLPCPILDELIANLANTQTDKICASACLQFQEVKWTYPDTRDVASDGSAGRENSRALVMSLLDTEIFWWDRLARTACIDAKPAPYPVAADASGNLYYHELGATADGAPFDWYFETADQYMDDSQQVMYVGGFWPDFQDQQGPINVSVIVRQYPQAPETTIGPFACAPPRGGLPGTSKVDFRISGRLARVRVEGNAAPTSGRLGLPAFDNEPAGER